MEITQFQNVTAIRTVDVNFARSSVLDVIRLLELPSASALLTAAQTSCNNQTRAHRETAMVVTF